MRRVISLLALLTAVALVLNGCALSGREPDAIGEISLPEPTEEPVNMLLGESLSNSFSNVTLYYAAQDGTGFSTVNRTVRAEAGQSLPEAAVNALLDNSRDDAVRAIADTSALACEYACGTATVNLSIDARNVQNPQELLALETSIGNTLLDIDGIRGVNVLIGGLSEGYSQLPFGVQTEQVASVTAAYAQLQAERERLGQEAGAPLERSALVYFPTDSGDWLVPELRRISAEGGDFVTALIDTLKVGPQSESCAVPSIPEGVELIGETPAIRALPGGERALDLNFSSTLANYLAFSGLDVWELAGSITLTMCSFLPELDAVRVMVNGDPITMCELGDSIVHFQDGYIHRSDFSSRIGSSAILYLVNGSDTLEPVQKALSMRSALSPRSLLTELIRFSGSKATTPKLPLPDGVYSEDILGVHVSGGIARVNLSGSFYRSCQALSPTEERNLAYAMVNTLCELESIRGVRFYVEGLSAETLAGTIYLRSVLLPNPGIVARSDS